MDIEAIENAIIERLKDRVPELEVKPYPGLSQTPYDPAIYQLLHPIGALLVRFSGESLAEPKASGAVSQIGTVEFEIVVVARNLRTHQGVYAFLGQIKSALTGKFNATLPRFYLVGVRFLSVTAGIWQYSVTCAFNEIHEEE